MPRLVLIDILSLALTESLKRKENTPLNRASFRIADYLLGIGVHKSRPRHRECVDFLAAGIAGEQRRTVRGDANLCVGEVDLAVGSERKVL